MVEKQQKTPQLLVERLAAGELEEPLRSKVRARLEAEGGLDRLAEIEASNADILAHYPPQTMVPQIEEASRRRAQPRRGPAIWIALPAIAAAAALLVMSQDRQDVVPGESPEYIGIKGETRLVVHRQRADAPELLTDGARARTGDVLQLSYVAGDAAHGAVLSIDGRGAVTLHFPDQPGASTRLETAGRVGLSHSYELDDAPDFERFFLVTSTEGIDVKAVLEAAEKLAEGPASQRGALQVPMGVRVLERTIIKVD